jgi:hypothetical protein
MSLHLALGNWSEISCGRDMGGKTGKGQPDFFIGFPVSHGKNRTSSLIKKSKKK